MATEKKIKSFEIPGEGDIVYKFDGLTLDDLEEIDLDQYIKRNELAGLLPNPDQNPDDGDKTLEDKLNEKFATKQDLKDTEEKITKAFKFKGLKDEITDLDAIQDQQTGDLYLIKKDGSFRAWDGNKWEVISSSADQIDIGDLIYRTEVERDYVKKTDLKDLIPSPDEGGKTVADKLEEKFATKDEINTMKEELKELIEANKAMFTYTADTETIKITKVDTEEA